MPLHGTVSLYNPTVKTVNNRLSNTGVSLVVAPHISESNWQKLREAVAAAQPAEPPRGVAGVVARPPGAQHREGQAEHERARGIPFDATRPGVWWCPACGDPQKATNERCFKSAWHDEALR